MDNEIKDALKPLAKAFEVLPNEKKEFLLGYAEGVAAMSEKRKIPDKDQKRSEADGG